MSGNGKQVQLAPGQSSRYACGTRPHTPQRPDGFSGPPAVGGSYVTSVGPHPQSRLPQPPTPPQQDLGMSKQPGAPMNYGQAGVRPQQSFQFRGGPPQPQQMRPGPHRQQASWANPAQAQQVMFSVGPAMYLPSHLPHGLPPSLSSYQPQQPPRTQYFQQPASMPNMMHQQHFFGSYPNQQGQQQYMYTPPSGQQAGPLSMGATAGRAQAAASQQSLQQPSQQQQQHQMLVSSRYTAMQHVPGTTTEKKRRTHALPIVDPKSGKDVTDEILEDDSHDTNSDSGERGAPQPDGNGLAVVEEFARRVSNAAKEKDVVDEIIIDEKNEVQFEIHPIQENSTPILQTFEEVISEAKPDVDPVEDKYPKHNQLSELSETPVVSAISNSPEIVPKQSHVVMKQKHIEITESKKIPLPKPAKQTKQLNASEAIIADDIPPEPEEVETKLVLPSTKHVIKPADEEIVVSKSEDKPVEVAPLPVEIKENSIQSLPVGNKKTKPGLVNDRDKKDIAITPFKKALLQDLAPKNQESPPITEFQNPPSHKQKQDSKKHKTRNNNLERTATQNKTSDIEVIPDIKPATLSPNNSSIDVSKNISPPEEIIEMKKDSIDPPSLPVTSPQDVDISDTLVNSDAVNEELKVVEVKLEELQILADGKSDSDPDVTDDASAVVKVDESQEITDISEVKVPQVVEMQVESTPAPESTESQELNPVADNAETLKESTESTNKSDPDPSDPDPSEQKEKPSDKPVTPMLRYSYREDQWSPLNTSGKKCYDTDFLLMLRNDPNSKKKPENINQLEIVADALRQPRIPSDVSSRSVAMRQNDLLPGFARSTVHSATPNRKSQHGKPNSKGISTPGSGLSNRPNIIHVNLSLKSDVKLNETQNAWKPARMRSTNLEEDEAATLELYKTFRSVLNKLTPQKFDTLIAKVRNLNIDTKERLIGIINLVFEKAIDEPNFSVAYALMCRELEQINVPDTNDEKRVNFRSLILGRCQQEFEKDDDTTKKGKKEVDECTDPEKKKELILNLEEEERKIRRRSVGNVRFIGELFKQNLIASHIIVRCMQRLLNKIEEETLECLCKLLTTIGKDLEKKGNVDLQPFFNSMRNIVDGKDNKVSNRVRFMLQDVMDLRRSNWVPRQLAANANPKTMDQIKLEVEMEQKNPLYSSNFSSGTNMARKDERPNNMNRRGGSKSVSDDGWLTTPTRNNRAKQIPYVVDSGKLKMMTATPITQTSLQPSTQFTWGKGSTVNTKKPDNWSSSHKSGSSAASGRKPATETSNMYHALDNQYSEAPSVSQSEASSARKMSCRSKGASIERSTFKSDSEDQSVNSSQESVSKKIKEIMSTAHTDTVYGTVSKILGNFADDEMASVVREMLLWGLEYEKKENMEVIGEITGRLVDDNKITNDEFLSTLKQTMDHSSSCFVKDGNNIWKMISAFIWSHLKKNSISLKQIHAAFSKVIELDKGFELLTAIFLEKLKDSQNYIKTLWDESHMELSDWMSEDKVEQFLEEFPLKWLNTAGAPQYRTPEEACSQMLQMMHAGVARDQIKEWINQHVGQSVQDGWFIRAITEAVHTYALCPQGLSKPRFDPTETVQRLQTYYPLLSEYVASQEKAELECLFAIQHLIHKLEHPQGITVKVFEYLWEFGEIVSYDGFITWENNIDPHEQEGKGVMLKTLTSFFTALKSLDSNDDESDEVEDGH